MTIGTLVASIAMCVLIALPDTSALARGGFGGHGGGGGGRHSFGGGGGRSFGGGGPRQYELVPPDYGAEPQAKHLWKNYLVSLAGSLPILAAKRLLSASILCRLQRKTDSNTLDCGFKLARLKEPQELMQVPTDFISRQAQALADQAKELNERFVKGAEELANTFAESTRRSSKAA